MRITISADAARSGALVDLCPRYGRPPIGRREQRFNRRGPVWLIPLIPVSILLVSVLAERQSLVVPVPYCDRCVAERRSARIIITALWVLLVVLFFGAITANSDTLVLVWFLAMIGAVVLSFALPARTGPRGWVSRRGNLLHLTNADDTFVHDMVRSGQGQLQR